MEEEVVVDEILMMITLNHIKYTQRQLLSPTCQKHVSKVD